MVNFRYFLMINYLWILRVIFLFKLSILKKIKYLLDLKLSDFWGKENVIETTSKASFINAVKFKGQTNIRENNMWLN